MSGRTKALPGTTPQVESPPEAEDVPAGPAALKHSIPSAIRVEASAFPETPTKESGKAALPPESHIEAVTQLEEDSWQPSENDLEDTESDTEEEKPEAEPVFTEADEREFKEDLMAIKTGEKDIFLRYRRIRMKRTWKLIKDDEGKPVYKNFDEFCEQKCGHKRQWVTHGTNWLAIMEMLEAAGITEYNHLSPHQAQPLVGWKCKASGGPLAVLKEATSDGINITHDNLAAIVERRYTYFVQTPKPTAKTYADYKQDSEVAAKLGNNGTWGLVSDAKKREGDLADNLVGLCTEKKKLPKVDQLLQEFTGAALVDVVARLSSIAQDFQEIENKKNLLKAKETQIKAMTSTEALKTLKEEAKSIRSELENKGAIPRKNKGKDHAAAADKASDGSEKTRNDEEEEASEVRATLVQAHGLLDDALTTDWPEEDEKELRAILDLVTGDLEETLTAILNKAKELLANQPAEISDVGD